VFRTALIFCFIALFLFGLFLFNGLDQTQSRKPSLIFDTDFSSDVDDVGAVAVLHGLARQGRVNILAMMVSSGDPWAASALQAVNTWFGRPEIPLGRVSGASVQDISSYTQALTEEFLPEEKRNPEVAEAVTLYRRILADAPDHSVTLVTVGYLTNLHHLLLSSPDALSPLDGRSLVQQKVHRLICMGGQYPEGREWNFHRDAEASRFVVEQWPGPLVFVGFEIGRDVLTGAGLRHLNPPHPVRRSYELYNQLQTRSSWDLIAVYYAVVGKSSLWSRVYGRNQVQADGRNRWLEVHPPAHAYLVQRVETAVITDLLDQLLLTTP
jgi:inosine-uridine nucleoside N-ribohydrolase